MALSLTKKSEEATKLEVLKKSDAEIENQQELVPVEFNLVNSEDENDTIISNIRALTKCSKSSDLMKQTLGALMTSRNS